MEQTPDESAGAFNDAPADFLLTPMPGMGTTKAKNIRPVASIFI
jgi:hypothetical protein